MGSTMAMYAWEGKKFQDVAEITVKRDPQRFRHGCATASADGTEIIQWFRSVAELTQYLTRMEPRRWGMKMGDLIAVKPRLVDVLTPVDVIGYNDKAQAAYNACVHPYFRIVWWGTFDELLEAEDTWPAALLASAKAGALTGEERTARLISYLQARSATR
ncbi:hypothetical protein NB231_12566 [Nitrococcus mobilis Nb-231]|uniref:Uncharacterized protein n=2 Tax=Nitrococcus mobilis TaxID=35797 RepID=A4BU48_9GAMM|nr:hypothetical protein NB231_12566 [Nitrococcus mobilis Nb-231]